jgi:mannose-6-phosphate isomerase-like protein (cupin superfamily)
MATPTTISRENLLERLARHDEWVNVDRADPKDRRQFALIGHPRLGQEKPVRPVIAGDHGFCLTVVAASPGNGPRLHSHDENETFMVLSGRWKFVVGDGDDQQTLELGKYDTITIPAYVPRTFINLEPGEDGGQGLVLALNMCDRP